MPTLEPMKRSMNSSKNIVVNQRLLPNLVIIGAMKCGTLSLHEYLNLHPQIAMTSIDELNFFVTEKNWGRGIEWYQAQFPRTAPVMGERSTNYTKYPTYQGVPERMKATLPDVKLIYCVRDPVDRVVSHYVHWIARGYENQPFDRAVSANGFKNPYIYWSQYYLQVEQYLKCYPRADILVLSLKALSRQPNETLRTVFEFLKVDPAFTHENFTKVYHPSKEYKRETWLKRNLGQIRGMLRLERAFPALFYRLVQHPVVSTETRNRLQQILAPDLEKFKAFAGPDFVI